MIVFSLTSQYNKVAGSKASRAPLAFGEWLLARWNTHHFLFCLVYYLLDGFPELVKRFALVDQFKHHEEYVLCMCRPSVGCLASFSIIFLWFFPFFLTFIPAHDIIEEQIRQVIRPSLIAFGCYALQRWQPFLFVRYSSWVMRASPPKSQR